MGISAAEGHLLRPDSDIRAALVTPQGLQRGLPWLVALAALCLALAAAAPTGPVRLGLTTGGLAVLLVAAGLGGVMRRGRRAAGRLAGHLRAVCAETQQRLQALRLA